MKRIALAVVWSSILFAAGEAGACEAHAAKASQAPPAAEAAPTAPEARPQEDTKTPDAVHAARCQCSSAADCTCKKGSCECAKCKKPRREQDPVKAEVTAPREGGVDV